MHLNFSAMASSAVLDADTRRRASDLVDPRVDDRETSTDHPTAPTMSEPRFVPLSRVRPDGSQASRAVAAARVTSSQGQTASLDALVLFLLREEGGGGRGVSANAIRKLCRADVPKQSVNRALYALLDRGLVECTPGPPPTWKIRETETAVSVFPPMSSLVADSQSSER